MEIDGNRVMQTVDSVPRSKGIDSDRLLHHDRPVLPEPRDDHARSYGHGTHVYSDVGPWGGYDAFHRYGNDGSNIATCTLHKAGYERR